MRRSAGGGGLVSGGSRWSDLERPPLNRAALSRALIDGSPWREVRVVDETGSTNADLAELARAGEAEGLVLVAEHQTAGKGRLDRTWSAPARSGLSFSVLLRPPVPASGWPMLPLLVGVGVAKAITHVADVEVSLKWPNDLLINDRKVGGILAERVESSAGAAAVVGIGLNVTLREPELPVPTAISLGLANAKMTDRDTLLRATLRGIAAEYTSWIKGAGDSSSETLGSYRELCATVGREVRVELPGDRVVIGRATGIDDAGSLIVETATRSEVVTAGDVVHVVAKPR